MRRQVAFRAACIFNKIIHRRIGPGRFKKLNCMENVHPKNLWQRPSFVLPLIGIILVAAIVVISLLRERLVNIQPWQVSVTGQGKVSYEPDIANISLAVEINKADKADTALKNLDETISKVQAAIKNAGVPDVDIQTQNYTLTPQYEIINEISKQTGYNAYQGFIIKIRDVKSNPDHPAQVIAAASQAGANRIDGIAFEASNFNDLKQEARLKAITDARNRAADMSRTLGVKLGKIVGWWENYITPDQAVYYDGKGGLGGGYGGGPIVPSGGRELVIEVNVSYLIK